MNIRAIPEEEFQKLPLEEKRMRVLKDALFSIKTKGLIPRAGHTLSIYQQNNGSKVDLVRFFSNKPLKQVIEDIKEQECQVCARGALLVTYVAYVNDFITKDSDAGFAREERAYQLDVKLSELFDIKQIILIEDYFEYKITPYENTRFFGFSDSTSYDRLVLILENMINNNGIFKPEN